MNRDRLNEKGATLVELLISVTIMLILAESFYTLLTSFYHSYETQSAIAEMQQDGRVAIDLFSREIAQAGYNPTAANPPKTHAKFSNAAMTQCGHPQQRTGPIFEASQKSFWYAADLGNDEGGNGNGKFDDPGEEIHYEWVGADGKNSCGDKKAKYTLYRTSGGGAQEVALNIQSFALSYFDEAGKLLPGGNLMDETERSLIRKVVIRLTARSEKRDRNYPANDGYRTREYVSEVWLKNL